MLGKLRTNLRSLVPARYIVPIKNLLGIPPTRLHPDWAILQSIGPVSQQHLVLDIGAHHGWFFHCWQDWCPAANVIAFEPFAESFKAMNALYGADSRVKLIRAGVGSVAGNMGLNVLNESKVSNSFLRPAAQAWYDIAYKHGEVFRELVSVTTIDQVFEQESLDSVYLMKVDVQGYEIEVLRGAERSLPKIDHIFVESGIQRLYEGAPRFNDVFEYLTARDFHLMSMRSWHRGNQVLVETDMLFRRNDLAGGVDPEIDRIYEQNG